MQIDPMLFNQQEPDESKRDAQIQAMADWYQQNKARLIWNANQQKIDVKPEN
jgi:hypothetical protein